MPTNRWTCAACSESNESSALLCARCECPSNANATEVEAHRALFTSTQGKKYKFLKCDCEKYEVGETRNSGGILSSVFEVETEKFSFISCSHCGHTEFYRCERSALRALYDLGF
ncbi:zinc ribbon domain-containing protein [Pseudomonas sp. MAP12]|uniref:Zinc ribbon domain-containing protein n=1 Tax=Geopseudomonas aromaticivorans TaxID=2849492 RepID=A0ABS6MY36_9GAMM|nr:zinc ribbon domain-containing protein [Pseudomonas aromaticivorans]